MSPIGLLGGTFDPIHLGHLRLAEELAEALAIDEVRFIPSGRPPHRPPPTVGIAHRLAMVRLAIHANPRFVLDEHEAHKTTPCYMVDTLAALRAELGGQRPLVLFLGADAFLGLASWHAWRRLFTLCHLAIARRPGANLAVLPEGLADEYRQRHTPAAADLHTAPAGRIFVQEVTQLDIAARRIRALAAAGRSIRYLVPEAVYEYIARNGLYPQED
ncbi:MAG: nicotinate-nucleotide adenylyltransferase [Thiobacillaceae bacterium]|nr:nicotinate-nucleotide adenylyltransferase [Thiobacillaceae bacterium]